MTQVRLGTDPDGTCRRTSATASCTTARCTSEVEFYRAHGGWGSRLAPGSGTFITIGYDPARFLSTLLER